jgi:hypothetical protein
MKAMKKYELTEEKIETFGKTLYRIKALINFSDVKEGDFGGYVEGEHNLSHSGDCWISGNAKISGNAAISGKML